MAKSQPKISLSASRDIPFNKLVLSQANVRRIRAGVAIEELAEDIARRTLLQSLTVRPILAEGGAETGMFEVPAGGRRYRALELLVKKKRLPRTAPIPCIVRTDGIPEEDSLAENVQRAPLHPLDQFRAFLALREKGQSEEEIAAAFFVSVNVVRQRLRLGEIEQRVLTALKRHLLTPDAVTTAVEAYRVERQSLSRARARDRSALEREISEAGRQIDRMIASIKDGVDPKLLVAELNNAQAKREALERQLRLADSPDVAVLHPQAAAAYRQKVVHIQEALARGDAAALEAVTLVRGLVHEIRVTPGPDRMELQVVGDLAALLEQEQGGNKRDFIGGCGGLRPRLL